MSRASQVIFCFLYSLLSLSELEQMLERCLRTGHLSPKYAVQRSGWLPPSHDLRSSQELAALFWHEWNLDPQDSTTRLSLSQFKASAVSFTRARMAVFWYLQNRQVGTIGLWREAKEERIYRLYRRVAGLPTSGSI